MGPAIGYLNKEETYQFRDYLSEGGFFMGKHFSVTPTPITVDATSSTLTWSRPVL